MKKESNISDTIRLLREASSFSQKQMAEKLSITQQAYSNIEQERMREIAQILQVNSITLFGKEDSFILQNINQSAISAENQMNVFPSQVEHLIYHKLITSLKKK